MFRYGKYWYIGLGGGLLLIVTYLQSYLVYQQYRSNQLQVQQEIQRCLDQAVEKYFQKDAPVLVVTVKDLVQDRSFEEFASTVRIDSLNNLSYDSLLMVSMLPHQSGKVPVQSYEIIVGQESVDSIISTNLQKNSIQFSRQSDTVDLRVLNNRLLELFRQYQLELKYSLTCYNSKQLLWSYNPSGDFQIADVLTAHADHLPDDFQIKLFIESQPQLILDRSWRVIFLSGFLIALVLLVLYFLVTMIRRAQQINDLRDEFVSAIAHELNTPLAVIGASLEAIRKFELWREADKLKKYLSMAGENVEKLKEISEKILDVSTIEDRPLVLNLQKEDLVALISPLVSQFQETYSNRKFIWEFSELPSYAEVDRFYFLQVINNLLDNAVRYGGVTILLQLTIDTTKICIQVSDDGKGIHPESVKRLFDKYYRGNPEAQVQAKGYGIGLYLSRKILQAHGGTLYLEQAQPPVFTIILPCD